MDIHAPKRHRVSGFTLIELLVVVSIISLLVALLLPTLAAARDGAKRNQCLVNIKQIGQLAFNYANDYSDAIPMSQGWRSSGMSDVGKNTYLPEYYFKAQYISQDPINFATPLFTCTDFGGNTRAFSGSPRRDTKGYLQETFTLMRNTQTSNEGELSHYAWTNLGGWQRYNDSVTYTTYDSAFTKGRRNANYGPYKLGEIRKPGDTAFSAEIAVSTAGGNSGTDPELNTFSGGYYTGAVFQRLRHQETPPVLWGDGHAILMHRQLVAADLDNF